MELNDTLDKMDLTDIYIYKLSSQRSKIHILFKCTWNTFKDRSHDRTQNMPQQIQENWNRIKRFLRPQGKETNLKEKIQKYPNSWKLNSMLLNNEWVKTEIKEEIKSFWKQMKINTQHSQIYGTQWKQSWEGSW